MIDWTRLAGRLAVLAKTAAPCQVLSVSQSLPHWPALAAPPDSDWCFWQRPERGIRLLGLGRACVAHSAGTGRFAALRAAQEGLAQSWRHEDERLPLAFTGFAFAPQGGAPFPNASLWVPELVLRQEDDKVWLTLSCPAAQADTAAAQAQRHWQAARAAGNAVPPAPTFVVRPKPLAEAAFLARGRAALRAITAGTVDKLVLTRSLRLDGDAPLAPQRALDALAHQQPTCAIFGVGGAAASFIGASPETLLALDGTQVTVDALAGTAWQTSALALAADKNRREHDIVARDIAAALAAVCNDIRIPAQPEEVRLDALTHLRRRILARRPATASAFDLIARLHPTPAVGGTPTAAALDWLARHGDVRDAWYTGGIGWIDAAGDCDIAVALRCGMLSGRAVTLQAGAGFVAGSDPAQELAETEAKFGVMRTALDTSFIRTEAEAA